MKRYIVITLTSLFLAYSCHDDDSPIECLVTAQTPCEKNVTLIPAPDTCFEFSFSKPNGVELQQQVQSESYIHPLLNPLNKNELIYKVLIWNGSTPFGGVLNKVDLCKGEIQLLNDEFIVEPKRFSWNRNGWLLFDTNGFSLWQIKENGDSLSQILLDLDCGYATYDDDKDLIYCSCNYQAPLYQKNTYMDVNGNILDTMDIASAIFDYHNGKTAIFKFIDGERYIGYIDMPTQEFVSVVLREEAYNSTILDMGWLDDDHIIWLDRKGIHQVNIHTAEIETLKSKCSNTLYRDLSVVPNHSEVYLSKTSYSYVDDCTFYADSYIILFDTETGEEWIVDLD